MLEQKSLQQVALDFVDSRSAKSFTALYNRLRPGLRKFITRYHQDQEIIDEILSITLSKAYSFVDKYDSQWNFSTWIYKICQNECLMEIRRQNSLISLNNLLDSKTPINAISDNDWKEETEYEYFNNEEVIQPDCLYSEILSEIENLPVHYREIISDRVVDKMKYQDIADKRGLKINTVRSRIHSAKKVIKNLWIDKKKKSGSTKNINIIGVTILQLLDKPANSSYIEEIENLNNIEIVSVKYGTEKACIDVTTIASQIYEEQNEITASNKLGGDPCYGSKKSMFIQYKCDGKLRNLEIKEGKTFNPKGK